MSPGESEKRRPAGGDAQCLAEDNTIITRTGDTDPQRATLTLADADGLLDHVRGALVVLTTIDGERYRRRVYLSAAAAEKHLKRARAAGLRAEVVLCEMRPVFLLDGAQ